LRVCRSTGVLCDEAGDCSFNYEVTFVEYVRHRISDAESGG
jgi:hypothetical protein